ncbi:MAG: threonine--tRNA ligase [Patescibacteria group bacterium]
MKLGASLDEIRHSLAHLLAAAVLKKYPGTKLGIGPVIENGFYYDFLFKNPISDANLKELEKEMWHLINKKLDFKAEKITPLKAKKLLTGQKFKLELVKELEKEKSPIYVYHTSDIFTDLCKGPHVKNTSEINVGGFKLTHLAGAYWKGSEKNPMLTRIYGLAFETKKELEDYLKLIEEAKKRDHRKLGKELKIFTFSDLVGPGLPLWLPNGAAMIEELEKLAKEMERRAGYLRVKTPHIAKEIMYKTSGHLPYYAETMFPPMILEEETGEKTTYYLKAMNCPHHHQIYADEPKSYRDLPLRLAEYGTCYRYEKSGELFGLMRVRSMQMNDAHIYCTEEQFADEFMAVIKMYLKYFEIFGINKYIMRFSTHNKEGLGKKYIDNEKLWKKTEAMVRDAMEKGKISFIEVPNEAAFYGPKIDVQVWSAIGKEFTLATNQVDFAVPERFGLIYTDKDGKEKTPICIHRAPLSTHERMIGFLIEHYAGIFPFWLAPEQIAILPISEHQNSYAKKTKEHLEKHGFRVTMDDSNNTIGKKIREAEMKKIPYIAIVGAAEEKIGTINIRKRGKGPIGEMKIEHFVEHLKTEIPF